MGVEAAWSSLVDSQFCTIRHDQSLSAQAPGCIAFTFIFSYDEMSGLVQ